MVPKADHEPLNGQGDDSWKEKARSGSFTAHKTDTDDEGEDFELDRTPLRSPNRTTAANIQNDLSGASEILVLHRVQCSRFKDPAEDHSEHDKSAYYFDEPRLFRTDTRAHALRGLERVYDVDEYLERHSQYTAVVYRTHSCNQYHNNIRTRFQKQVPTNMGYQLFLRMKPWFYSLPSDMLPSVHFRETITIVSLHVRKGLDHIAGHNNRGLGSWDTVRNLTAPYDYFLQYFRAFSTCSGTLPSIERGGVTAFLDYINHTYGAEHDAAEELFAAGIVTKAFFPKLFRVRELIVMNTEVGHQAYQIEKFLETDQNRISLLCSYWQFDGTFRERQQEIAVTWPGGDSVPITSLSAYPLKYDVTDLTNKLEERGTTFWKCRNKKVVSYIPQDAGTFELHTAHPKFMIDLKMHRYLHPDEYDSDNEFEDTLPVVSATDEDPPSGSHFLTLLPPSIIGYGFHDKKWRTLQVQFICEVSWNTKAFDRLVLKSHKKELIQAVITSHLEKNRAADIVDNKGNGLVLLLHGPPGTGKTLTAESVAEVAQKPLYRITCGDIGTEPQNVETYLDSALHIGTVWDCVMLLDEADVFLEERTQTDLVRNALVAVFLRVLEYYDGILILTTNRVALFDEAFKSRIQMAIFFPKLDERGRKEVWRNFFRALQAAEIDIDDKGLQDKVATLAENEFNGRQIRNIIKTARQLAKFHSQVLRYQHLERVIDVAKEFEEYLDASRGCTDAQWAETQHLR